MSEEQVPATQPGDPPLEPESETTELVAATVADGDEVPDVSEGVPQDHAPSEGSPS